jgi:hypothetical protein
MRKSDISINERWLEALETLGGYGATLKQETATAMDANGTSWVNLLDRTTRNGKPVRLCKIKMTVGGSWAGTPKWRIIDDEGEKIYPFPDEEDILSGIEVDIAPDVVLPGIRGYRIQFRSTNSGDGSGKTVTLDFLDCVEY